MLNPAQLIRLKAAAPEALLCETNTKLPAALTIAQWALESGWGRSQPGNNCFGIKEYTGCDGRQLLETTECFSEAKLSDFLNAKPGRTAKPKPGSPGCYIVKDWFATFATLSGCFKKHGVLITAGNSYSTPWRAYLKNGNVEGLVRAIAPIYATAHDYAEQLLKIMMMSEVKKALSV